LALIVAGRATTLAEGFEVAASSVSDGRAAHALERLVELSNA
jgi:anthranilate phosphoribosyltransferase